MSSGRRTFYWDSCVFIAWLQDEQRAPGDMEGIADIVAMVERGEAVLISSVITRTEILQSKLSPEAKAKLDALFQRKSIVLIGVDLRIADLSHEVRDHYAQQGKKLTTADCIHLATAITYSAQEFHTFDGAGKARRDDLIPLSGDAAVHHLTICTPTAEQPSIPGLRASRAVEHRPKTHRGRAPKGAGQRVH